MSNLYTDASLIMYPSGYKEDKIYSLKPTDGSGDLTFTRASTATRVNSEGLIKGVRTNLVSYSEEFDNAYWTKLRASVSANIVISPDGTTNADKIIENTENNSHGVLSAVLNTSGQQYSVSVYVKAAERSWFAIYVGGGPAQGRFFDVSNGVLGSALANTPNESSITDAGNGWYRCSIVYTATDASSDVTLQSATANGTNIYTGDGTSGVYLYGAQVELSASPTDYIPTTTTAVSVGMLANVPRIDYTGGGCGSLLLEKQSSNLATYSSEFDNAAWVKFGSASVVPNQAISPDGTQNADLLNVRSTNVIRQSVTLTASTTYSCSFFAKKTDYDIVGVQTLVSGSGVQSFFNLDTGVVSTQGSGHTASIKEYSNGWYRCIVSFNCGTSTSNIFDFLTDSTSLKGFYIYGAQLESGTYSTSLINTTSTAVTRLADSASKTGISSLIGQTQGTLFCDFNVLPSTLAGSYYVETFLTDGTSNNKVALTYYADGRIQFVAFASGSLVVNIDLPSYGLTVGKHKFAFAYKLNDYVAYADGALVGTDTSATVPPMSALNLYDTIGGTHAINQAIVFPTRLTNTQLQSLTSL